MQGALSEFTVAELLQLFALAERTGVITVQSEDLSARLFLESGRVVGMGDELFDVHGQIMACELLPATSGASMDSVIPVRAAPGLSFIVKNLIEPERWDLFTRRCLEQHVYPILSRERGTFDVLVERIPPCPLSLTVPVQQLILDGSRWEAEMAEHRADGFELNSSWRRSRNPGASSHMTPVEWLTWAILEKPTTIVDVARRLCVPDLDATVAVRQLCAGKVLQPAV